MPRGRAVRHSGYLLPDAGAGRRMPLAAPCLTGNYGARYSSLMTPPMELDREASQRVFEQVAAAIRRAIAEGEARPGERLPPARDLAAELGVNSNTVLRALRLLRDEGLLEFRRGRGVTVAGTPERTVVLEKARELVALSRVHGFRREEVVRLIESLP
jgi:GntR family transcriptional regulator